MASCKPGVLIRLEDPAQDPLTPGSNGAPTYSSSQTTLQQVALHEIGHALGLAESPNPASVMFPDLGPENTTISASDIANGASLYSNTTIAAMAKPGVSTVDLGTLANLPGFNGRHPQFLHAPEGAQDLGSAASAYGSNATISVSNPITLLHSPFETKLTYTDASTRVNSPKPSQGSTAPNPVGVSGTGVSGGKPHIWGFGTADDQSRSIMPKPN